MVPLRFSRHSISFKLILWLALTSLVVTVGITTARLWHVYRTEISRIEADLDRIEQGNVPTLSRSMWVMDFDLAHSQLEALVHIDYVAYAAVREGDEVIVEAGQPVPIVLLERSYPLKHNYDDVERRLGTLVVQADVSELRGNILHHAMDVFVRQGMGILAVLLLMALISHLLVTRHLQHIARHLRRLTPREDYAHLRLDRRPQSPGSEDELEEMVNALNTLASERSAHMRNLETELNRRIKAEQALQRAYGEMEQRVRERTAELEEATRRAQDSSATKSEFLANMSHEIRTPLNGVLGMLQLASMYDLDSRAREYVEAAFKSGRTLLTVINDILDFSKIEAGKIEIRSEPFRVREVLDDVLETFSLGAKEKGVTLLLETGETLPEVISGDIGRLRQVLFNLVGNALKFTQQGEILVEAYPLPPRSEGKVVRLLFSVTDTGIGMSDEQLLHIFEPFSQVDGSHTRVYQGTGLGLAIVKRLVGLMGGNVSISSESGKGTQIMFCISAEPARAGDLPLPREPLTPPEGGKPLRILVVEDNPVNMLMVVRMLERLGHTALTAENGREALGFLSREDVDLVLMDVQMPEMDGLEATRRIRSGEAGERVAGIPVAALTAHAMKGDKERFMDVGMNDYIAKPIDFGKLQETLARLTRMN